ncbi:2295_t:CDS:2 [Ambispora leptoticha]|uniref:2295_t:CDS:1 n=1 Tax=Ambispora leptoticha TaxID=144679 RepID=A0A9N9FV21_9GLOM|nr:2295_t:CDS:2 [Ambispora leptoticha]
MLLATFFHALRGISLTVISIFHRLREGYKLLSQLVRSQRNLEILLITGI